MKPASTLAEAYDNFVTEDVSMTRLRKRLAEINKYIVSRRDDTDKAATKDVRLFMKKHPRAEKYRDVMAYIIENSSSEITLKYAYRVARELHKLPPYNGK